MRIEDLLPIASAELDELSAMTSREYTAHRHAAWNEVASNPSIGSMYRAVIREVYGCIRKKDDTGFFDTYIDLTMTGSSIREP